MPTVPKRCSRCLGSLEARNVEHPYWIGLTLVAVVKGVPAWVCQICGYHYFDPKVETTLSIIVRDYVKMGALNPLPVTSYRER